MAKCLGSAVIVGVGEREETAALMVVVGVFIVAVMIWIDSTDGGEI